MEIHFLRLFFKPVKLIKLVLQALYAAFPQKNEKYKNSSNQAKYRKYPENNYVLQDCVKQVFPRNFNLPFHKARIAIAVFSAQENLQFPFMRFSRQENCPVSPYFEQP